MRGSAINSIEVAINSPTVIIIVNRKLQNCAVWVIMGILVVHELTEYQTQRDKVIKERNKSKVFALSS